MGLINKNGGQNRSEHHETTSQPPTNMHCPANGCCLPADTPNGGEFACVFHADQPTKYWPLITEVTNEWLPAWIMAHQLDRNFGDEDIAHEITQQLNALPPLVKRHIHFVSEVEAWQRRKAEGRYVPYDVPLMTMHAIISKEIGDRIKEFERKNANRGDCAAEAQQRRREDVRTMCARIANRQLKGMRPMTHDYDNVI